MARSLRGKITLALFVTGLTSAVLVGVIARVIFMQQFNRVMFENSFSSFQGDVAAYIREHGTLDAAMQAEAFPAFVERRRMLVPAPQRTGPGSGGPPGGIGPRGAGFPADGEGLGPPGRGRGRGGNVFFPPFFFLVLDVEGRPVVDQRGPSARIDPAVALTPEARAQARPIYVGEQIAAYAVPVERPNLTEVDVTYLTAMQNAVLYGVAGAGVLALALGFFFGSRLSVNLRTMANAIQAVGSGQLRQHVKVTSKDEVGLLASAFNQMTEELQQSTNLIREQAERLKELSIRDENTRLHNRRYFDEQAAVAYARARRYDRPFTVAICDIDHFKQINDRFSHAAGDEVLRRVAKILAASTRDSDIVARYGGEEFVIALPETALAGAAETCERIRREIEQTPWHDVRPGLAVTITIGLDSDVSRGSVERMLEAADEWLYKGKHAGRNRVCSVMDQAAT